MKLLFVINPVSGDVNKEPFLNNAELLCKKYGIAYHFFKTTGTNDADKLSNLLQDFKPDRVASVGGDGTTLFTAVGLLGTAIPMGIIPLGSANGLAEELFTNTNPDEALKDIIMSNVIGSLDILKVNTKHYAIHLGDVGLNAKIVEAYNNDESRGFTTYAKYFIKEMGHVEVFNVKVAANNTVFEEKGIMLGICNGRKYGTGMPLTSMSNPMDGKFEIVLVKKMDVNTVAKAGLSIFNEDFIDAENMQVISTEKATITFDEKKLLQLDGEIIGEFDTLDVEIIKSAVKLITHNDNSYLS
ncbi:MAG TPA: diacylglycerol kinase family protein [Mariniflexile sp.]|nr:diacylglycerol kinase family protein [Mariniflexile sp.]